MNSYESLINTKLDNRYLLTDIVGIGGMAVVYEAEDTMMNRKVAIKMLKDEIKDDIQEVKRFINESKAVAMLSHQNIVHIYDVSVKDKEHQYIVMEYIDGITLKDYMVKKNRINWREAYIYIEQILQALKHAHEKDIVHRDIKPQNIILLRNGSIKITDFGIAKIANSEPLTMTDKTIGTVHYISPEQASGTGAVTCMSDIYSVGVLLYEMTTGVLPFQGNTAIQIAMMQVNDMPKDPRSVNPEIPKGFAQIILKAMEKQPEDRYQTAMEMIKHLMAVNNNPSVVFNDAYKKKPFPEQIDSEGNGDPEIKKDSDNKSNKVVAMQGAGKAVSPRNNNRAVTKKDNKKAVDKTQDDGDENMRKKGRNLKKRRRSRSMLPIISGVTLAFLIILGISGFNILMSFLNPANEDIITDIKIPNYIGKIYNNDLITEMQDKRLRIKEPEYVYNDVYGKNEIISQNPEPDEIYRLSNEKDRVEISLKISKGKDSFVLPDLSVTEYREAVIMLKEHQIQTTTENVYHDTILYGYIVNTAPAAGTTLSTGDTVVLYVSQGQEAKMVLMPDLIGMTVKEAKQTLSKNDIVLKEIKMEYSDLPAGSIISQDIKPSLSVPAKSTKVIITISSGPKPPPEMPQ